MSNYSGANFAKANAARRAAPNCKAGHPFSGDNLRLDAKGRRVCRACALEFNRRRRFAGAKYLKKDFRRELKAEIPAVVESVAELAERYELPVKNEGLTHPEWLGLYGIKPKRVLVIDGAGLDGEW